MNYLGIASSAVSARIIIFSWGKYIGILLGLMIMSIAILNARKLNNLLIVVFMSLSCVALGISFQCDKIANIPNEYEKAMNASDGYSTEYLEAVVTDLNKKEYKVQTLDGIEYLVEVLNSDRVNKNDSCRLLVAKTPEGEIFFKALERK